MEKLVEFITANAAHAHWFIFASLLLAGCNIPISIDIVLILGAVIASSFAPEKTLAIYFSLLFGCTFSAWIAFSLGKFLGCKLSKIKYFSKILHPSKMQKMQNFYSKYGIWTFILGRFIPFGVRNCIFMTSGMSGMKFKTFALRDAVGCFIWTTSFFSIFYLLGQNFDAILSSVKSLNAIIFSVFSVTVIISIWYKLRKKRLKNSFNKTS